MIVFVLLLVFLLAAAYAAAVLYLHFAHPQTKWDWSRIDTEDVAFPGDFLWGTATAAHQIEGDDANTNWGAWERDPARIKDESNALEAVDGWSRALADVRLMINLGVNSYRFSLAWNKIEPAPGEIDEAALRHYDALIDELAAHGIEPLITLHHFTHPDWFERLGAFEKEENIAYFVRFAELVFARFRDRVRLWVTINEPNVFITNGYFSAQFPPGVHNPRLAGEVLKNMLKAHVEIYRALKALETISSNPKSKTQNPKSEIGLATSLFQFEPARRWHLGDWAIARAADASFNDSILGFFRSGRMKFRVPGAVDLVYEDRSATETLDFIGVNYYSHFAHRFAFDFRTAAEPRPVAGEEMTDMQYTIYPEGLHRAIREAARLGVPIVITENGIADARDDRRDRFIRQSLYALSRAWRDGFDVRGYFYWSLMDNFEWAEGYTMKFGLYEVDLATQERTLREGAKAYAEIIAGNSRFQIPDSRLAGD